MATGGHEEISKNNLDVVKGSEALFDHVCQPCSEETTKEAVGFCVDCADWLCDECFRTHRRPKPTRHHALKNQEEMKNSTPSLERVDKCTEKCESHGGKKLKYFCPIHDKLGCSLCIIQSHRTCAIHSIPDMCKADASVNDFQQITARLEAVAIEANGLVSDLTKKVELVNENKSETVNTFRKYGKKLHEFLDNTVIALEEQCEERKEDEIVRLKAISERCESNEKDSLLMMNQLEDFEQRGQHCNRFVALKRYKSKLQTMESSIKQAKESSRAKGCMFRPNVDVDAILKGSGGIGTINEIQLGIDKDYAHVQAQHVTDINVQTGEKDVCRITGSVILPRDRLVLIDHTECQVKVVDTNQNKMISTFDLVWKPWGVCKVNDNTVAVTLSRKKRISFMAIDYSGQVSTLNDIAVNGKCQCVTVVDDRMIVTYKTPDKMEIMDMSGSVLHTITTDDQGEHIFHNPKYVCSSQDKEYVYVSNLSNSTVVCMKLDGKGTVVHEYKDCDLQSPEQVAVDKNGMLYIVGYKSKNVHLTTPDCKKIKIVLSESDGLTNVNSVCYCVNSDRLYIGMNGCDIIKVFQLSF